VCRRGLNLRWIRNGTTKLKGGTREDQRPQYPEGKITEIVKGATTSHVRIDIAAGVIVTSSITNEAVADLALEKRQAGLCVSPKSAQRFWGNDMHQNKG
jgi:molybdopterin-binding protein